MEIGVSEESLRESAALRVRVSEDFELDGGTWKPAVPCRACGSQGRSERILLMLHYAM